MKKIIVILLFWSSLIVYGQDAFKYQAVIRDASGDIISNESIEVKISILSETENGTEVFQELHNQITSIYGNINLEIGRGTVITGIFDSIEWGQNKYFLKVEIKRDGESQFVNIGISELLSVPISLYSKSAGNTHWIENGDNIYFENGVGIGINEPARKLHIRGDTGVLLLDSDTHSYIEYYKNGYGNGRTGWIGHGSPGDEYIGIGSDNSDIRLLTGGTTSLFVGQDNNIGIGTNNPDGALHINTGSDNNWTTSNWRKALKLNNTHAIEFNLDDDNLKFGIGGTTFNNSLLFFTTTTEGTDAPPNYIMTLKEGGNVGIGTISPAVKLHLLGNNSGSELIRLERNSSELDNWITSYNENNERMWVLNMGDASHNNRFGLYSEATGSYLFNVNNTGVTSVRVLEILGGGDLTEPFNMTEKSNLPKGSVVVIDDTNPGHLTLSNKAYDKRVAGVISGANGVNPGITLSQEGVLEGCFALNYVDTGLKKVNNILLAQPLG